jgi:hypothetical protein
VVRSGLFDKRALPDLQELYESGKMPNMSVLLFISPQKYTSISIQKYTI